MPIEFFNPVISVIFVRREFLSISLSGAESSLSTDPWPACSFL